MNLLLFQGFQRIIFFVSNESFKTSVQNVASDTQSMGFVKEEKTVSIFADRMSCLEGIGCIVVF
jgi:hypothetical protein